MNLSERLRCDAECLQDGAQKNLTKLWHSVVVKDAAKDCREASKLLRECERAFAFIAQAGCDCDECNKARDMLKKLRCDAQ